MKKLYKFLKNLREAFPPSFTGSVKKLLWHNVYAVNFWWGSTNVCRIELTTQKRTARVSKPVKVIIIEEPENAPKTK